MNRNHLLAALLLASTGCVGLRPVVQTAPVPTAERLEASLRYQTRVLEVPYDEVFPRILEVLLDRGFLVRAADRGTGLVSFFQQWKDTTQISLPDVQQEGTLLFRPDGAGRTRVRLLLTGKLELMGGGMHSTATVSAVQQDLAPDQYRRLLDAIEQRLIRPERPPSS